jgi:hypothetical protein
MYRKYSDSLNLSVRNRLCPFQKSILLALLERLSFFAAHRRFFFHQSKREKMSFSVEKIAEQLRAKHVAFLRVASERAHRAQLSISLVLAPTSDVTKEDVHGAERVGFRFRGSLIGKWTQRRLVSQNANTQKYFSKSRDHWRWRGIAFGTNRVSLWRAQKGGRCVGCHWHIGKVERDRAGAGFAIRR